MKLIIRYLKTIKTISIVLGISLIYDVIHPLHPLKNLMVKANSTSISPYNTDGVATITGLIILLIIAPALAYLTIEILGNLENKKDKKENKLWDSEK